MTKNDDLILMRVLFTAGFLFLLLFLSFRAVGNMPDERRANLSAVFGIPFLFPGLSGTVLALFEYFTDFYRYKEQSFYELWTVSLIVCFFTVMLFSASFWIFNRHALGLRLSKYRDMRTVALKTMAIPMFVCGVYAAYRLLSGK